MTRHLLAIDQGTTGTHRARHGPRGTHPRPRDPRVPAAFPAARVGRARARGDLAERDPGRPRRPRRRRSWDGARLPPSASPTSAKPRWSGSAPPGSRFTAPSSGRTDAPAIAAPSSRSERPRRAGSRADRAGARSRTSRGRRSRGCSTTFPGRERAPKGASSRSEPSIATWSGGSPAARFTRATSPTRRARCS